MWSLDIKQFEELFYAIFHICVAVIVINILVDYFYLVLFKRFKPGSTLNKFWASRKSPRPQDKSVDLRKSDVADAPVVPEEESNIDFSETAQPPEKAARRLTAEAILPKKDLPKEQRARDKKRIGHIFLEHGLITREILDKAVEHQKKYGGNITQYLLHYGYINEKQLAQCLSAQYKLPYLPVSSYAISDEIIKLIPRDIVEKYWVLPVDKHGKSLTVVMFDPLDTEVIKKLEDLTGLQIIPFVGIISEILVALQIYYKLFVKDDKTKMPDFFVEAKTYTGVERRAAIRYVVNLDVRFPADDHYLKSQTIDVSRDGFSFTSMRSLDIGSFMILEINLPKEVSAFPIGATTQVIRCLAKGNNRFEIGAKTLKISENDLRVIIEYAVAKKR